MIPGPAVEGLVPNWPRARPAPPPEMPWGLSPLEAQVLHGSGKPTHGLTHPPSNQDRWQKLDASRSGRRAGGQQPLFLSSPPFVGVLEK